MHGFLAYLWLAFLFFGLPFLGKPRLPEPDKIPRAYLYLSAILSLVLLTLITLTVSWKEEITRLDLGIRTIELLPFFLWTAGALCVSLAVMAALVLIQSRAGDDEPALVRHLMPQTELEAHGFLLLSLCAGIGEEIIFRGFAMYLLRGLVGIGWVALLIQAFFFGWIHGYQSRWGMARAALVGVVLGVPALWTGSLFPSIAAHFLIDALMGIWIFPVLERYLGDDGAEETESTDNETVEPRDE